MVRSRGTVLSCCETIERQMETAGYMFVGAFTRAADIRTGAGWVRPAPWPARWR